MVNVDRVEIDIIPSSLPWYLTFSTSNLLVKINTRKDETFHPSDLPDGLGPYQFKGDEV
jgi:hypothetical protein